MDDVSHHPVLVSLNPNLPEDSGRTLFLMHLFGAVIALYLGEETGKVPPIISTRSVWIVVGVLFMGAGPMWMLGIK